MEQVKEMTRELVIASLKHCAKTGVRCVECPCGGAPACKVVYAKAVEIMTDDQILLAKKTAVLHEKQEELDEVKNSKSETIHKMWDAMLQVQQAYSSRCKDLEDEVKRLKGW